MTVVGPRLKSSTWNPLIEAPSPHPYHCFADKSKIELTAIWFMVNKFKMFENINGWINL